MYPGSERIELAVRCIIISMYTYSYFIYESAVSYPVPLIIFNVQAQSVITWALLGKTTSVTLFKYIHWKQNNKNLHT